MMRGGLFVIGICGIALAVTGCGEGAGGSGGDAGTGGGAGSNGTGGVGGTGGAGGVGGTGGVGGAGGTGGVGGCAANIQCAPAEYCQRGDECGLPGACANRPEICAVPAPGDEVCGCDGNTYASACLAAANGASVAFAGGCPNCVDNEDCMVSEFCANEDDCDAPGICAVRPELCLLPMPGDEVCGCDGTTHDSDCFALGAGVRVAAEGPCP